MDSKKVIALSLAVIAAVVVMYFLYGLVSSVFSFMFVSKAGMTMSLILFSCFALYFLITENADMRRWLCRSIAYADYTGQKIAEEVKRHHPHDDEKKVKKIVGKVMAENPVATKLFWWVARRLCYLILVVAFLLTWQYRVSIPTPTQGLLS